MQLTVSDRTLDVTPVKVRDLPAFLTAVEPIARDLAAGDLPGALARQAGQVIEATRIGAGVDRAWLDAQDADALVQLASAVMEVNADFFVQRVMPALEQATQRLAVLGAPTIAGGTSGSSGSAAPDSATTR